MKVMVVSRRFAWTAVVWLCACVGCAYLWTDSAQARIVHVAEPAFGGPGSGAGQFEKPLGVAVNDATHDVYVVDSGNNRVEQFDSTGSTLLGELDGSGAPTGVFSEPTQIAVDNSGNPLDPSDRDVYVVDRGHNVIDKFSASGAYEDQLTGICAKEKESPCSKSLPFSKIEGVAVAPDGALWVIEKEGNIDNFTDGQINEYIRTRRTPFGGFLDSGFAVYSENNIFMNPRKIAEVNGAGELLIPAFCGEEEYEFGVAVDALHGEVYVDDVTSVEDCSLAGSPSEKFASGDLVESHDVAVDESNRRVYVSDAQTDRVAVFAAVTLPTVSVGESSEQSTRALRLNGTVNPEGEPVSSCMFEYDTRPFVVGEAAHGSSLPCEPGSLGSGSAPVPVSARLSGLTPEAKYYYRLVARNTGGASEVVGEVTAGPVVGSTFETEVRADSAILHTSIDPNGANTHYYFEYGTTTSYGSYAPFSPPGADIGSLKGVQSLEALVQGLEASRVYHYRLVVTQDGEAFAEADQTFTTQPAGQSGFALPDGRAWELVSPAEKKGALIEFLPAYSVDLQAASDGSAITYAAFGQLGEDPVGETSLSHVFSQRGPGGWSTRDISLPDDLPGGEEKPAKLLSGGVEYRLFSPDLSLAAVEGLAFTPSLSPEVSEGCLPLYLREQAGNAFSPIVTPEMARPGTDLCATNGGSEGMSIYAATPDLNHLVLWWPTLTPPTPLTGGSYTGNLYEEGEGQLRPIGILPSGAPSAQVDLGGNGDGFGSVQRAISNEGRWVAWTEGNSYNTAGVPLYVRDMFAGKTVQVGGLGARYQTMNEDGSKIFFLEGGDLHLFETATGKQLDLTADHGPHEANAGVRELVSDVSGNGSYIYFVADGVLADGAVSGEPNLYLLHEEAGAWSTTYIATLSSEDEKSWYEESFAKGLSAPALDVSSRVSPDGRYLAFMSERSLTGYDNIDASSPPGEPRHDEEVFLYDAFANRLVCASCDPTGARPTGILDATGNAPLVDRAGGWNSTEGSGDHWLAGSIPGWDEGAHGRDVYQPRYLSDSGRLFFDSPDELVPQATNGLEDVYEYEPPGIGDCTAVAATFSERSDGCVGLISSGISSAESAFFDASENGDDVFFITSSKLVSEDFDTSYDVYDAHVCSQAVPCRTSLAQPPPCNNGEACKPPQSPQPELFGPAPSATFSGAGNVISTPGKVSTKSLTRAQKLARALKECHRKARRKRATCEKQVKARYRAERSRRVGTARQGGTK